MVRRAKPQIAPGVRQLSDQIACENATQSELVLLVFGDAGQLFFGVFEIDSHQIDGFCTTDAEALQIILQNTFVQAISLMHRNHENAD